MGGQAGQGGGQAPQAATCPQHARPGHRRTATRKLKMSDEEHKLKS